MKRTSLIAVFALFAAMGCNASLSTPQDASAASASASSEKVAPAAQKDAKDVDLSDAASDASAETADAPASMPVSATVAETDAWAAGDFVVYRFSGSMHKAPLTLTEKVVSRDGSTFVLDVTLEGAGARESLRVWMKGNSPASAEATRVVRLTGAGEEPATVDAYEALLAKVAISADQNEALLQTENTQMKVQGAGDIPCEQTTYRVRLGTTTATLRTLHAAAFAWGDLGAEMRAEDGKLLFKAEVIEAGKAAWSKAPAVASVYEE